VAEEKGRKKKKKEEEEEEEEKGVQMGVIGIAMEVKSQTSIYEHHYFS
jgi:hypothetical protein